MNGNLIFGVLGAVVLVLILVYLFPRVKRIIFLHKRHNMRKLLLEGAETWKKWRLKHPNKRANLFRADLRWANLPDTDLRQLNLNEVDFYGANLYRANLEGANLNRANFEKANLREANLKSVNLIQGNLSRADMLGVKWQEMHISKANIWGIKNPPDGFKEWSLKNAAVETEPGADTWNQWPAIEDLTCEELKELHANPTKACKKLRPYLWATDPDLMQHLKDIRFKFPGPTEEHYVNKVMEWIRIRARRMGCPDW